ncbi:MAG: 16S rRNA (guanine(966)-N(2))-methyltransferase RsmD [Gammaproteobacteria bacterium]|nr:16S rRNA (guanine(966)-N(2))-methyltransferase RsmD [Gammaproteobacteria bacterium]NND61032.1 16S rRNA (guanine(966)-N(2))-methyltransferase RsmD [Gammaproteobacteria bacterium]
MAQRRRQGRQTDRFRIIGGQWRGRRLDFPSLADIRPTPDRVRETVFNWLQPVIAGARCLDLYAGSGALGLEALSRGAGEVVFVDRESQALDAIGAHLQTLDCDSGRLERSDARRYLEHTACGFDVVFVDPPFDDRPWDWLLPLLASPARLNPGARIYFEQLATDPVPALPDSWRLLRSKRAGRVGYHLAVSEPMDVA